MKINKIILMFSILTSSGLTVAMQPLDDQSLSSTTGQDGINVGIGIEKITFNQASLIDKDGISTQVVGKDYNNKAALSVAGTTNTPVAINFVGATAGNSVINAKVDTDAGSNKAFANIAVGFANGVSAIKVSPFAVYSVGSGSISNKNSQQSIFNASGGVNADVSKILTIGSAINSFEINFHHSNSPQVNIQLGDVPQSHMLQFSGAIQAICGTGSGCPIAIVSGNSGAQFDMQMKATDTTNGFLLKGLYAGVEQNGLVVGHTGNTSKMNVSFNNVTMGTISTSTPTSFNGLSNSSMGSFGAIGASVKDLKVNIRGL